jgi:uncharacterized DUF497 family protein
VLLFKWDLKKAKTNLGKHGISFAEASTAFKDPLSVTMALIVSSATMIRLICYFNHEVHEEHEEMIKYFFTFVTLRDSSCSLW